jgi:hypothetical protein
MPMGKTRYNFPCGAGAAAVLCELAACEGRGDEPFAVFCAVAARVWRFSTSSSLRRSCAGGAYVMQCESLGCDKLHREPKHHQPYVLSHP